MATRKHSLVARGEEQRWLDAALEGRLLYQQCTACGAVPSYLRAVCPTCWSEALVDKVSSGRGEVYSFTTQHRAGAPVFKDDIPYTLVLVDLDEGFRVLADLRECPAAILAVGLRVQLSTEPAGSFQLPGFRPSVGSAA